MKKSYLYITLSLFIFVSFVSIDSIQAQQFTLIAIGDSLTQGVGDNQYENDMTLGYPGRLKNMLFSRYDVILHNLGVPGYDSSDVIKSYDPSETSQLDQALRLIDTASNSYRQPVTLVWVGSNDLWAVYDWKCNTESPPSCTDDDLSAYSANIENILSRLTATESIVFIALQDDHSKRPVVSDGLFSDSRPTIIENELPLLSAQVSRYNTAIKDLANRYGAIVVDTYNTTIFEDSSTISSDDGDHPNSKGYDQLANIWYQAVISTLNNDIGLVNANRLFSFAEAAFPNLFTLPGTETYQLEKIWVRYYENTNTFLGVLGEDVYVYGETFGGLIHVGKIGDFI